MRYYDNKFIVTEKELKCLLGVASKDISRPTLMALHFDSVDKRIAATDGNRVLVLFGTTAPTYLRRSKRCFVIPCCDIKAVLDSHPVPGMTRNGKEITIETTGRIPNVDFPAFERLLNVEEEEREKDEATNKIAWNAAYLSELTKLGDALGDRSATVKVSLPINDFSITIFDIESDNGSWRYGLMPIRV